MHSPAEDIVLEILKRHGTFQLLHTLLDGFKATRNGKTVMEGGQKTGRSRTIVYRNTSSKTIIPEGILRLR